MECDRYSGVDARLSVGAIIMLARQYASYWGHALSHEYLAADLPFVLGGLVSARSYGLTLAPAKMNLAKVTLVRLFWLRPMFLIGMRLAPLISLTGMALAVSGAPISEYSLASAFGLWN
jgi:hypothetical protein